MDLHIDRTRTRLGQVIDEREQAEKEVASGILDFYLKRYPEVFVVICSACKEKLALEYLDPAKLNPNHHFQRSVIELSPDYRSFRSRLDGVVGYQCKCGNDNRWAYIEWSVVRHGGQNLPPHEEAKILEHIKSTNHVPDVRIKGNDTVIENKFTIRKLK